MELNKLDIFIEIAKQKPKKRVAVAAAEEVVRKAGLLKG